MPDENGSPLGEEFQPDKVFAALADPHRRRVMAELAADETDTERSCSSFGLPLAKSTQSHLFKILGHAGLVTNMDYGNRAGVAIRRRALDERFPGLVGLLAAENTPRPRASTSVPVHDEGPAKRP